MTIKEKRGNREANKLLSEDRAAHSWYRFVLSFPPHLVRDYTKKFNLHPNEHVVLDPFCGTGTTLVECKKLGISSVGIEAHPFAYFASKAKINWTINPDEFVTQSCKIADEAASFLKQKGILDDPGLFDFQNPERLTDIQFRTLEPTIENLLLTDSISKLPLHKVLVLRECLNQQNQSPFYPHQLLALANALTFSISNLHFGPEVGVGQPKLDSPVVSLWLEKIQEMAHDLRWLQQLPVTNSVIYQGDSRQIPESISPQSIDAVFTSPPYPNEKDYTRTTRLETVVLDFLRSKSDLQALKRTLLRSNTRGVYKGDDDDLWAANFPEVQRIAETIETRRIELGKTSGFERLYAKVTKLYFGGMARHLASLRTVLKPGAQLGYVVGDQASYLRVMIHTSEILATIAESLGYEVIGIDLFRTRMSTATKEQLNEEVLLLRWHG